jgi:hypothetical protein
VAPDERERLLSGEERHDAPVEAFGGDAEDSGDHGGVFGVAQGGVAKQRADRGESQVPRSRAVVAVSLEVLEERRDQRLIEVVPVQRRRSGSGLVVREAQQRRRLSR